MKQLLGIMAILLCVFKHSYGMGEIQPPLTDEMLSLGLTSFKTRNEQIRTIYFVDDAVWQNTLEIAAKQFTVIEKKREKEGDVKELIPLYWQLSQSYDYGPANAILHSAFCLGEFGLTKSPDWSMFLSTDRPSDVYDMNFNRRAYLRNKDYFLSIKLDQEQRSDSSEGETAHNGSFTSSEEAHPKNTDHDEIQHLLGKIPQSQSGLRHRHVKNIVTSSGY